MKLADQGLVKNGGPSWARLGLAGLSRFQLIWIAPGCAWPSLAELSRTGQVEAGWAELKWTGFDIAQHGWKELTRAGLEWDRLVWLGLDVFDAFILVFVFLLNTLLYYLFICIAIYFNLYYF